MIRIIAPHVRVAFLLCLTFLFSSDFRGPVAEEVTPASREGLLQLRMRKRIETETGSGRFHTLTETVAWEPRKTALVICDMWDQHWCKGATRRVAEMAPRMNKVVAAARKQGVLIIHCPSGTLASYEETPQLLLAQKAPVVKTAIPLENWCHLEKDREGSLPIDDSDGGCDCSPRCQGGSPWKKQIAAIEIAKDDAISDSATAYYLMQQRGIENVIVMGVHTNMCVLGRPFSIRQMIHQGKNVVLMRDMTDTMYNSRSAPFVSHFTGTDLVVEHIEKHWCPTITSVDFLGGKEFRFAEDKRPHLVMLVAEDEYETEKTLPKFAAEHLGRDFRVSFVFENAKDHNELPGLDVLSEADLVLVSMRRRVLSHAQLEQVRKFVASGKPVVGLRTASHAFSLRNQPAPEGHAAWPEFDADVLGGNYTGHHGHDYKTFVRLIPEAAKHPILQGVDPEEFEVTSWLYKTLPLAKTATPLMLGRAADITPHEPVAWTNLRGPDSRVFYTSLGHPRDFEIPAFRRLLQNGIYWAAGLPVPKAE